MDEVPGVTPKDSENNPHMKLFIFDETPNLPWTRGCNTDESRETLLAHMLESLGNITSATVEGTVIKVFLRDSSEVAWLSSRSRVLNTLSPLVKKPI